MNKKDNKKQAGGRTVKTISFRAPAWAAEPLKELAQGNDTTFSRQMRERIRADFNEAGLPEPF